MENTRTSNDIQDKLPDGISIGVIPPDGTQLALSIWLRILGLTEDVDSDTFVRQLRKDNIPHVKFCGTMLIDATHIRRIVHAGRNDTSLKGTP